jgi:hypothetical protein
MGDLFGVYLVEVSATWIDTYSLSRKAKAVFLLDGNDERTVLDRFTFCLKSRVGA